MRVAFMTAFLLALPLPTLAYQEHGGQADDRLVREYTRFAGSKSNAESLVNGLRNDTPVTLKSKGTTTPTTFTPPTSKMGYGNVDIALSLAKASLAEQGILSPTPEQIRAALNGGKVTTKSGQVTLPGVLKQRASGMGWGKVAQANGFKLGEVMRDKGHRHGHKHGDWKQDRKHADRKHDQHRGDWKHDRDDDDSKHGRKHADWKHDRKHSDGKHDRDHAGWKHDRKHSDWKDDRKHHADGKRDHHRGDWKHDRHHADWKHDRKHSDWKHDRGDYHRARYDRPERSHKIDRPERFERPERPERPERHHRR